MATLSRSVLITGTSAGSIGSALVAAFANKGFDVFATARDPSKIERSLADLPNVYPVRLDVTSQASIREAYNYVTQQSRGRLDYLVNNAGAGYTTPLVDFDEKLGRRVFDVNFWGVLSVTKAFMPLLVTAKGTVVNVSSVGAIVHTPWIGIYSASKAALTCASETLRLELSPLGVNVVTAMVGSIKTKFHSNNMPSTLPSNSLYRNIQQFIKDTDSGKLSPPGTDVNVFAEQLVGDVLKGKKGQVWRGKMAKMTKWVSAWVPWGMLDGMVAKGRGLDRLQAAAGPRRLAGAKANGNAN